MFQTLVLPQQRAKARGEPVAGGIFALSTHLEKGATLLWPGGTIWFVGSGIQLHHFHLLIRDHSFGVGRDQAISGWAAYQSFENIYAYIYICIHAKRPLCDLPFRPVAIYLYIHIIIYVICVLLSLPFIIQLYAAVM